jgi:RNA polymerase sigma factor (sigma-70 family)
VNAAVSVLVSTIEQSYEELLGYVSARVGCRATAADIVHETYLRVAVISRADGIENPKAFVYTVASNLALDHLRQEQSRGRYVTRQSVEDREHPHAPSPEIELEGRERLARLMQAVDELPPRCREVFVLRRFENLHQAEIAGRLGISRNMVEKHMRRALLHFLQRLGEAP